MHENNEFYEGQHLPKMVLQKTALKTATCGNQNINSSAPLLKIQRFCQLNIRL